VRVAPMALAAVLLTTACTGEPVGDPKQPPVTTPAPTTATPRTPGGTPGTPGTTARPRFDAGRALATVRDLAAGIGPRLATGSRYAAAAAILWPRLVGSGYDVRRQTFPVPAGDSWGVPVGAGRSLNVVATPPAYDPSLPYAIVGAHLDTVAVAPGAEDNASGVAVVMELARTLGGDTGLPVVLVLFGGEEPRGPGDLHHFGSRHYVARMSAQERRHLVAMVSLDRVGVGVGEAVPLHAVDGAHTRVRDDLARTAAALGIPTVVGTNTGSDHESFSDAGLPAARVGGTSYAAYHSADDLPGVVDRDQLARVGRLLTAWITGRLRGR
jgi:aminopeptidase YwaD